MSRPRSWALIGRYLPGVGIQAHARPVTTSAVSAAAIARLGTDPRLQVVSPRVDRIESRPMMMAPAVRGSTTLSTCTTLPATSSAAPSCQACATAPPSLVTAAHPEPSSRGIETTIVRSRKTIIGTVTRTHAVITTRAHGLSRRLVGSDQRCGRRPASVGRMRW